MHHDVPNCLCKNHRTEETGMKILQKRQGANWPRTCVFKQLDEALKKGHCACDAFHCWQARRAQNKACSKSDVRSNSSCSLVGSGHWGAMTIKKRGDHRAFWAGKTDFPGADVERTRVRRTRHKRGEEWHMLLCRHWCSWPSAHQEVTVWSAGTGEDTVRSKR